MHKVVILWCTYKSVIDTANNDIDIPL